MADNTDEEHLDNPTKNQSENPPDEISPINDTETINSIQETEEMEVHHHAHDPAIPHHKKNWKSYFWEFLMLFLAVFCGFLAEYQLEHKIERDREKILAASLYEDLKKDTVTLSGNLFYWRSVVKSIDTIRIEIEKPATSRNTLLLYRLAAGMRGYSNFEYHDRTIEQLKNGGNFRLIRKTTVSDSLTEYDAIIKSRLRDLESQIDVIYQTLNFLQDKLINSKYFNLTKEQSKGSLDSVFKLSPTTFAIAAGKESELFEYYNHLQYYQAMNWGRIGRTKGLLQRATNLMVLLKKEYNIKE